MIILIPDGGDQSKPPYGLQNNNCIEATINGKPGYRQNKYKNYIYNYGNLQKNNISLPLPTLKKTINN